MGCHLEITGLVGVISSSDGRGWEQDCGDLGHRTENWAEKPLLQEGDDQHPGTNIFGGASLPQDRENKERRFDKKI